MRRALVVAVGIASSSAFAGDMTNALALGASWGGSTLGYARALIPAMFVVAFLVDLVFRDPARPPSIAPALWRTAVVFALLTSVPFSDGHRTLYGTCVGAMAGLSDSIASSLAPKDVWSKFKAVNQEWMDQLSAAQKDGASDSEVFGAGLGGLIFGALIGIAMLIGQASMWVLQELAKVLVTLLYALGPLALAFSIPRVSDSLQRWLRTFVSVLAWPVISAVLLAIITNSGLQGLKGLSPAFASIATALLLSVCACAVPVIASSLVGGGMGAIGGGLATLAQAGSAAAGVGAAAGGAASAAAGAGSSAASTAADMAGGGEAGRAAGTLAAAGNVMSNG